MTPCMTVFVSRPSASSRTTGTGKNKKTITATAVLEASDSGAYKNYSARFLVSGKVIAFSIRL